jgi:hypothetical protein
MEVKQRSQMSFIYGRLKIYYSKLLRVSEDTLSRWSRIHLQSLAPTNPNWSREVGYGTFFLFVIYNEGRR